MVAQRGQADHAVLRYVRAPDVPGEIRAEGEAEHPTSTAARWGTRWLRPGGSILQRAEACAAVKFVSPKPRVYHRVLCHSPELSRRITTWRWISSRSARTPTTPRSELARCCGR